jgi:hypothetical protein
MLNNNQTVATDMRQHIGSDVQCTPASQSIANNSAIASVDQAQMVSGFGQYHTNEYDPKKPNKKLTPYVTTTWPEIVAMAKNPPKVNKSEGQWFMPSTLASRTFKDQEENGEYWVLAFDFDQNTELNLEGVVEKFEDIVDLYAKLLIYFSSGATLEKLKCRVLIPLAIGVSYQVYKAVLTLLNDKLEARDLIPDRALERAGQVVYLPNKGEHYGSAIYGDSYFDPHTTMAKELDDYFKFETAKTEAARIEREARKAQAIIKRDSIVVGQYSRPIDAFNAAYTVDEILTQHGYDFDGKHNYRHPNSDSGSFSASVKDGRVYSQSTNDPLYTADTSKGAHDAFSVLCTLAHGGDQNAAIKDAGDNWLLINGEPWNKVSQREYMENIQKPSTHTNSNVMGVGEFLSELKPPCYVWQGVAEKDCLYAITANPGSGKTAIALLMALSMTQGVPLHNRKTMQSKVLYLCGENPNDVKRRFKVLLDSRGLSVDQLKDKIFFTRRPFNIDDDTAREDFLHDAALHAPYDSVFIDTVPAHSGVEEENANAQQQKLAQALRSMGEPLGQPCIFALMHPVKDATRDKLLPRGGSSLTGSIDGVICIWKPSRQSPSEMFAHQSKFRGHWPESVYFDLQETPVTGVVDNFGDQAMSVIAVEVSSPTKGDNGGNEAAITLILPEVKVEILGFIKFIIDRGNWVGDEWDKSAGNHLCKKGFLDYEQFPPSLNRGKEKALAMKAVFGLLNDGLLVKESREIPNSTAGRARDRKKTGLWLTQAGLDHLEKAMQPPLQVFTALRNEYAQASKGY